MAFSNDAYLPTYDELNEPILGISAPALKAGAIYFGKYCEIESNEFMLCKKEEKDPRKCLNYNKQVNSCALDLFYKIRDNCAESFTEHWKCLDKAKHGALSYKYCKKSQLVFDGCMKEKLNIERPEVGELSRVRLFNSSRAKPIESNKYERKFKVLDEEPTAPTLSKEAIDSLKRTNKMYV